MGQWFAKECEQTDQYAAIFGSKPNDFSWHLMNKMSSETLSKFTNMPKNLEEWVETEKRRVSLSFPKYLFYTIISNNPIDENKICNELNSSDLIVKSLT